MSELKMETLVSLCKRRGIIFPGSDLYGGLQGTFDYGPIGVELKNNVKKAWWRAMVYERDDIEGLDAAILMHPRTWEASGHVEGFTDPLCDCRDCKRRFRADHIEEKEFQVFRVHKQTAPDQWEDTGREITRRVKRPPRPWPAPAPMTPMPPLSALNRLKDRPFAASAAPNAAANSQTPACST